MNYPLIWERLRDGGMLDDPASRERWGELMWGATDEHLDELERLMNLIGWPDNLLQCIADDERGAKTWPEFEDHRERLRDFARQLMLYAMSKGLPELWVEGERWVASGFNGWLDFARRATPLEMGEAMLGLDCQPYARSGGGR